MEAEISAFRYSVNISCYHFAGKMKMAMVTAQVNNEKINWNAYGSIQ